LAHVVSSLAYSNLLRTKRLGCVGCCWDRPSWLVLDWKDGSSIRHLLTHLPMFCISLGRCEPITLESGVIGDVPCCLFLMVLIDVHQNRSRDSGAGCMARAHWAPAPRHTRCRVDDFACLGPCWGHVLTPLQRAASRPTATGRRRRCWVKSGQFHWSKWHGSFWLASGRALVHMWGKTNL
jgi:hypothetical protein